MLSSSLTAPKDAETMGGVSFHSGKKSVQIHGCEYAYAWALVDKLSKAMADLNRVEKLDDGTALNTVIISGSPPIQFLVCFAGLGDPWFWIRGEDRAWLADIIEDGLKKGIMRRGFEDEKPITLGWDELIALLRKNSTIPVVTTYSTNCGPITSLIQRGNRAKIAAFLAKLEADHNERWRRVGPDNLHLPRFRAGQQVFEQNRKR